MKKWYEIEEEEFLANYKKECDEFWETLWRKAFREAKIKTINNTSFETTIGQIKL